MPNSTWFASLPLRRATRLAAPFAVLAALSLACTVEEGERATSGTCPEGETCSTATAGLVFHGPPAADGVPSALLPRIAAGGSLNLHFVATDDSVLTETIATSTAPWFLTVERADLERDAFAIWNGEGDLHLEGEAAGTAHVRVAEAADDAFIDRVAIQVERIARVDHTVLGAPEGGEMLLAPGDRASIVFQLLGDSQLRLVDESMTIEGEDLNVERVSWDCVDVIVPDADEMVFVLDAGHRRWEVRVPIER